MLSQETAYPRTAWGLRSPDMNEASCCYRTSLCSQRYLALPPLWSDSLQSTHARFSNCQRSSLLQRYRNSRPCGSCCLQQHSLLAGFETQGCNIGYLCQNEISDPLLAGASST